jgi:hypothetical protein
VDRQEGTIAAWAVEVDRPRHQFLARPAHR